MKKNEFDFLKNVFLFSNIEEQILVDIIKNLSYETVSYSRGEQIYSPNEYEKKIGFILTGECLVERMKGENSSVPLNKLTKSDSFGIMAVFSQKEFFPTKIIATKESKILFIKSDELISIIKSNSTVAINVITFLAKKVEFLNQKIATFSSDTVEAKLANYLLMKYQNLGPEFSFNCKQGAEAISAGRASLYRALSSLENAGIIMIENKKIYIKDLAGLERTAK